VTSGGHPAPAAAKSVVIQASKMGLTAAAGTASHRPMGTAQRPSTAVIGEGRVDGEAWKVTETFYPTFPKGYPTPSQTPPPGWPKNLPWSPPKGHSLICLSVTLGGTSLSGGPLDSCDIVNGPHDTSDGGHGDLWGTKDKGTTGTHLLIVRLNTAVG